MPSQKWVRCWPGSSAAGFVREVFVQRLLAAREILSADCGEMSDLKYRRHVTRIELQRGVEFIARTFIILVAGHEVDGVPVVRLRRRRIFPNRGDVLGARRVHVLIRGGNRG